MSEAPVVASARSLKPLISEHRREGEVQAALASPVVEAAGKAGLFRLFAPKEVGGLEVTPSEAFRATVEISAADPAVSWYIVNSMPACMLAAALPETERNALFAEPDKNFGFSAVALAKATPVDGGYRLNGSWPVVTGCNDAKWCALAGIVMAGDSPRNSPLQQDRPDVRIFLVPTEQLEIAQTWQHAAAMRGTGSNQATATDVFVPEVLACSMGAAPLIDRPLYRHSPTLLTLPIFAAVAVGILQGAIEIASVEIAAKVSSVTGKALKDQTETQIAIADASAALRAIRAGSIEAFDAVWEGLQSGEGVSNAVKAEMYSSSFYAGDVARQMISLLYTKGTRAAFMQGHALERCMANIHAVVAAIDARRGFHHSAGAVMLGGEPLEAAF
ncbi:MAG: acyl-CoA dehydrogenase family protein [Gammaproteobacteria bacterium]|nr:acyl-CoA dehydrogenase family protein [Gammaproteobacteria bacterium]MBQ0838384.1 acyl-CoA dehydrogenase family protein [Gammaproteobacteria bacterium]